ncbi:hypothetical protein F5887DRAFT_925345 [Amanita rubescens]|nr:hypothetical protein F5887DRAFT_925345 [Amanita rubescens]
MPSSSRSKTSKSQAVVRNSGSESELPLKSKYSSPSKKSVPKRKIKKEEDKVEENSSDQETGGVRKKQRLLSPWPASPESSKRVLSDDAKTSSKKVKKTMTIKGYVPKKVNYVEIEDDSQEEVETSEGQFDDEPKTPSKGKDGKKHGKETQVFGDEFDDLKTSVKGKKCIDINNDLKKNRKGMAVDSVVELTRSKKLYPRDMDVPDDSDYDNQEDVEPVITDLMPLEKQDPKLRADYIAVPEIPYKEMQSFFKGNHATEEYSLVWGALETEGDEGVLSLPFINPSCIPLSMVQRENDRVILANAQFKKQSAVFLTTGVVSYCQLIMPGNSLTTGNYKVKQILLCPFGVEYERASAFIGGALDISDYVVFVTRGESYGGSGQTGVTSPGPSTPSKTHRGRKVINFKKTPALSFPNSLNFTDDVPIYDIRRNNNFAFTSDDLVNLHQLPLYEQGTSDLPPETLATIGYTVSSYPYRAANHSWQGYTVISLNILFVIALGHVNRAKLTILSDKMYKYPDDNHLQE